MFVIGHGNGQVSKVTSSSGILEVQNETCEADNDGAISLKIPSDQLVDASWSDGSTDLERTDLAPGMYTLEVKTTNGCLFTEEKEVSAGLPYPDQPVITVGSDDVLSTDVIADSYQWYLNGAVIPGATETSYTALESGTYSLIVSNGNSCDTASDEVTITVTQTLEQLGFEQLSLSPNPFDEALLLRIQAAQPMAITIQLADASGKSIRSEKQTFNGVFEKNYTLQDLPSGIYYFTVINEKGEWSERVVKQ